MNEYTLGFTTYHVSHFSAGIHTSRPRWVFITAASCSATCEQGQHCSSGLDIRYTLNMTNGSENGRHYFSADKTWLPTIAVFYAILYGVTLLPLSLFVRRNLERQKKYHHTVALLVSSVWLQFLAHCTLAVHYSVYRSNGRGYYPLEVYGVLFGTVSDFLLLLMIILVGKGWTIVRRKISARGRVKIACYMTTYVVCTWSAYVYNEFFVDPAAVVYIYNTAPGRLLISLRVLAFVWLSYSVYTTHRQYHSKRRFFFKFWLIGSYWTLSLPVAVGINSWIDLWYRQKFFALLVATWQCSLHFVFLFMYNPGFLGRRLNRGFPYHATTNDMMKPRRSENPEGEGTQRSSIFTNTHLQKALKLSQKLRHGVTVLQTCTADLNTFLDEAQTPSQRLLTAGLIEKPSRLSPDVEKQQPRSTTKLSPTKVIPGRAGQLQVSTAVEMVKPSPRTTTAAAQNKSNPRRKDKDRLTKSRSPRSLSTRETVKPGRRRRNSSDGIDLGKQSSKAIDEEQRPHRRVQRSHSERSSKPEPKRTAAALEDDDDEL